MLEEMETDENEPRINELELRLQVRDLFSRLQLELENLRTVNSTVLEVEILAKELARKYNHLFPEARIEQMNLESDEMDLN